MRIDKLLAHVGYGTRKEVKSLLKQKVVYVNDILVVSAKAQVDVATDEIRVEDEIIEYTELVYLMMNKPTDVISATEDFYATTVLDLIEEQYSKQGVFPVGRLDKDTTGLLLLTNDGKLAHQLLAPQSKVDKEYVVEIVEPLTDKAVQKLEAGVTLDDGYVTLPAQVIATDDPQTIHLIIQEGKFHQVKRMLEAVANKVTKLQRIRMGSLHLDDQLLEGETRFLTEDELELLQNNTKETIEKERYT